MGAAGIVLKGSGFYRTDSRAKPQGRTRARPTRTRKETSSSNGSGDEEERHRRRATPRAGPRSPTPPSRRLAPARAHFLRTSPFRLSSRKGCAMLRRSPRVLLLWAGAADRRRRDRPARRHRSRHPPPARPRARSRGRRSRSRPATSPSASTVGRDDVRSRRVHRSQLPAGSRAARRRRRPRRRGARAPRRRSSSSGNLAAPPIGTGSTASSRPACASCGSS